jgi:rare lipoprotein A (peptidoglycan hydrolase)
MTRFGFAFAVLLAPVGAQAAGWETVHKYVKPSGQCAGQEVLASWYSLPGRRTANGELFDANGNTAAARSWPLGTVLRVTNPKNGRALTVRINDRGPYGIAWEKGARLDLARGAAQRLGMPASQYVCVDGGLGTIAGAGGTSAYGSADGAVPTRARQTRGARKAPATHPADRLIHLY